MTSKRVLVALSGGVDSSVAACILQQQGYDVVGVFLRNGIEHHRNSSGTQQGCCSVEDSLDAALVANQLGIPFHAINMETEFSSIIDYIAEEYLSGRTPNPCMRCNRDIKFGALWDLADAINAQYIATGHYARVVESNSRYELHRGVDRSKDQSYVIFPLGYESLSRTLFPLGGLTKAQTREIAKKNGFNVHDKQESFEICFVPENDYRAHLKSKNSLGKPGNVIDESGKILAKHDGYAGFTRGQRKGLGFASTQPMYVLDIRPEDGSVVVGPRSSTTSEGLIAKEWKWLLQESSWPNKSLDNVFVQYRSSVQEFPASLKILSEGQVRINFENPVDSVNPGQGIAVYSGTQLLGGGIINEIIGASSFEI